MRAHLRQIVNTFIHVQAAAKYCIPFGRPAVDNETGAFSSVSSSGKGAGREGGGESRISERRNGDRTVLEFILQSRQDVNYTLVKRVMREHWFSDVYGTRERCDIHVLK